MAVCVSSSRRSSVHRKATGPVATVGGSTATRLGRHPHGVQYQRAVGVRKTLEEQLALVWGCQPGTAHQRLYSERGVFRLAAEAAEVLIAAGRADQLATLRAPLDLASVGGEPLPLPDALAREAELACFAALTRAEIHLALETGTLTVQQLREFARRSAALRDRVAVAERAAKLLADRMEGAC